MSPTSPTSPTSPSGGDGPSALRLRAAADDDDDADAAAAAAEEEEGLARQRRRVRRGPGGGGASSPSRGPGSCSSSTAVPVQQAISSAGGRAARRAGSAPSTSYALRVPGRLTWPRRHRRHFACLCARSPASVHGWMRVCHVPPITEQGAPIEQCVAGTTAEIILRLPRRNFHAVYRAATSLFAHVLIVCVWPAVRVQ
jgi:hypothetical protein